MVAGASLEWSREPLAAAAVFDLCARGGARSVRRSGAKEVGSEVGSDEVSPGTMAQNTYGSEIPVWDGDPNSFERFASACQWYSYGLKDNERHLAAARVWNKMTGPTKGVVRHLSPEEFACSDGISKLLEVLRASPLQKLPIPDSFSRLEKWSNLGKRPHETIPQLIVREEELFTEVQASLKRAREMAKGMRGPEGLLKGKGKGGADLCHEDFYHPGAGHRRRGRTGQAGGHEDWQRDRWVTRWQVGPHYRDQRRR